MAQSVKRPTLDLSSGLDLRVVSSRPMLGSRLGMEPTSKKKKKKNIGSGPAAWLKYYPPHSLVV